MTDDSQNSGGDGSEQKPNEFEFDVSDIPGLNLASDSPVQESPAAEMPAFDAPNLGAIELGSPDLPQELTQEASSTQEPAQEPELTAAIHESAEPALTQLSPQPTATAPAEPDAIQKVKEFSEKMPMEKVQVPAAFPFSLLIDGELTPEEKEKLLDVLSRENMGIREVDLEPQFANNRVLIPRISEYAGVLLVQALRATRAKMRLGPSESIFSAQDAEVTNDPLQPGMRLPTPQAPAAYHPDPAHPAEQIAITPDGSLPQLSEFDVIDTLHTSAILSSNAVEAEQSSEYIETVENLKRELKYKAYRKGAVGIIHFKAELQQLSLGNQYRLLISGTAIRPGVSCQSIRQSPPLDA